LEEKYTTRQGRVLMSGIDAIVRTVLDQRRLDDARGLNTAAFVSLNSTMASGNHAIEGIVCRPVISDPNAALVFLKRISKRYSATPTDHLLQALALVPGRKTFGGQGAVGAPRTD